MNNAVPSAMPGAAVMIKLGIMAMLPLLLLGACAETQSPTTIAAAPSPVSSPAPTPTCHVPPGSQADKRDSATAWQKAVDRLRAEDCSQALDPQPTPMRPEYSRNPQQENLDRRSLDPVPNRSFSSTNQGAVFRYHIPFSQ
jgi:hypothetical protein